MTSWMNKVVSSSCNQIQSSLAPPSADRHGHWHDCRLNHAKCSASQIRFLQGELSMKYLLSFQTAINAINLQGQFIVSWNRFQESSAEGSERLFNV